MGIPRFLPLWFDQNDTSGQPLYAEINQRLIQYLFEIASGGIIPPAGDIGGTTLDPVIVSIQGTDISAPPGGTTEFLRGDGTWEVPPGSSSGISPPAGDIGGTTAAPTIAKLQGTALTAPPGGTTLFLRGDGTWHAPPGTGGLAPFGGVIASDYGVTGSVATWETITLPSTGLWKVEVSGYAVQGVGGGAIPCTLSTTVGTAVGTITGPSGGVLQTDVSGNESLFFAYTFLINCTTAGTVLLQAGASSTAIWDIKAGSGFVAGNA